MSLGLKAVWEGGGEENFFLIIIIIFHFLLNTTWPLP